MRHRCWIVLLLVAVACGGDTATPERHTTTTTTTVPAGASPVMVVFPDHESGLVWWAAVPEHDAVAYAQETVSGAMTVASVDARGSRAVLADEVPAAAEMRLAPDGRHLAVAAPEPGRGWSLWTVPTSGGEVGLERRSEGRLSVDEFTADSRLLLYRALSTRPTLHAIALDDGRSSTLYQVPADEADTVMGPATVVGDRAVFATHDERHGVRLWAVGIESGWMRRLALPDGIRTIWRITAAGDGRHALVEAKVDGLSSPRALYAVWSDGRGPAVLLDDGGDHGVAEVGAAGDDAVYRVGANWYSAPLTGAGRKQLDVPPVSVPGFPAVHQVAVSADGSFVFSARLDSGLRELYHFDPTTDTLERINGELEEHAGVLGRTALDWVLDFALLGDGRHVAYTTGLAGRSAEIPYRLYIAPLP